MDVLCGLRISRAVSSIAISLAIFSFIVGSEYAVAAKSDEVEVRGSKVFLSEGEAMKATLKAEKPTSVNEISFSARNVGLSDPFTSSRIPFTVEVYESGQLVASESFTQTLDDKLEKVSVQINNIPNMDEKYKVLIRYDVPEGNEQKNQIQIDADTIKINEGEEGVDVHGKIRIVF